MSEAYLKIADGLKMMATGYEALASEEKKQANTKKADKPPKEKPNQVETPAVTVEDVRAVLAVKTRDGKTQKVKELLNQFGAEKLSSVPDEKLAELKEKAEVL